MSIVQGRTSDLKDCEQEEEYCTRQNKVDNRMNPDQNINEKLCTRKKRQDERLEPRRESKVEKSVNSE